MNRLQHPTEDMKEFVQSLAGSIPPEGVLTCFRLKSPAGPIITSKDITNLRVPTGGGSQDVSLLLQRLLFWISPSSRQQAQDLYQVLEAASVPPHLLLTDADPGVTAAIATVLPYTLHLWCLWHLLQNLRNNLDKHLTPNVRFWAGFNHTRFSTGAVSTQRGEGLNRHFKAHLSAQSPLSKLFNQVLRGR